MKTQQTSFFEQIQILSEGLALHSNRLVEALVLHNEILNSQQSYIRQLEHRLAILEKAVQSKTYKIELELENVIVDSGQLFVAEHGSYLTTFRAMPSYQICLVSVKMGDNNITSKTYDNARMINIEDVTDNIVITIKAS